MDLRHLTDKTLLADTKFLASREREITTKMLHHLKEIDKRRLYSDLGFSSLYDYCIRELQFSNSSAHRRIQGARLLADLPLVEEKIENGSLSLTNASLLAPFFKENNVKTPSQKMKIIERIENLSSRDCEKELFKISGKTEPYVKDKAQRISQDKIRYTLTLSDETNEVLNDVKDLIEKKLSLDELIRKIAIIAKEKLKKDKFKLNRPKKTLPAPVVNRVIPASVKREVYLRDQTCTNCGSTKNLQYDHIKPFAMGGNSKVENIRLLCFNCNQRARARMGL
jgi:hypothetical protein